MRFTAALLAVLMAGCTPSWAPLYLDTDVLLDPALPGLWRAAKADRSGARDYFVVSRAAASAYRVIHSDSSGATGAFTARLVQLGRHRFIDLFPDEPPIPEGFYTGHLARTHTFGRLTLRGDRLQLAMMNPDWFKTPEGKQAAPAHLLRDGDPLLIAPTAKLREFVAQYAESPAFDAITDWVREK